MAFGFSLGGDKSSSSSSSKPWKQQREPLKRAFGEAERLYGQGTYEGPYAAPISPYSREGIGYGVDAARSAYDQLPGMYEQFGGQLTPMMGQAQNYYNQASQPGYNQNPYGSEGYMGLLEQMNQYNPALDYQLEAAKTGINRNMEENLMTGIRSGAGGTGNTASSRRAIAEGIAMRGANDSYAQVEADLRGRNMDNAYGTASQWAGFEQSEQERQLQMARDMFGMGSYGVDLTQQGFDSAGQAAGQMAGWGDYQQGLQQEQIDASRAEYNAPWDNLQRLMSVIGGQSWGSETEGDTESSGWGLEGKK